MDDDNYITISLSDILRGAIKAHKDGEEKISEELKGIYFKATTDTFVFPKDLPLVKYLEKINKEQSHVHIDSNILLNSLGIAKAKYNHEMEKKLNSYYQSYMDSIRDGVSDVDIIAKILADEKVVEFIIKNNNLDEYISDLQTKKKKNKVKVRGLPEVA